jgi:hypothetical protein
MRRHYHVVENVPGYLPESDPDLCRTKREAETCARERARRYREDWDGNYRVRGNSSDGYTVFDLDKSHDLGVVIEINACTDDLCAEDFAEFDS